MLEDRQLARISLLFAIAGIIVMLAIVVTTEPKHVSVSMINREMLGHQLIVEGSIKDLSISNGNVFFELNENKNNATIKVIMFERTAASHPAVYSIANNDTVVVNGKLQEYRNELEIVATKIEKNKQS